MTADRIPISQAIRPAKGMSFLKWLIRLHDRWWLQFLNLPLFYLMFLPLVGRYGAVNLLVGILLHEIGHYALFRLYGVRPRILGLWPLGVVAAPANEEQEMRSDRLPWWQIGWLLLAGPAVNVGLMVVGLLLLFVASDPLVPFATKMVEMNGILAILNLVPLWNLDAGQFFQVTYSSLKEKHDKLLAIVATGLSLGLVVSIGVLPLARSWWSVAGRLALKGWWVLFVIVLVVGAWHKQGKDSSLHSKSIQAMDTWQVIVQLVVYFTLALLALATINGMPMFL